MHPASIILAIITTSALRPRSSLSVRNKMSKRPTSKEFLTSSDSDASGNEAPKKKKQKIPQKAEKPTKVKPEKSKPDEDDGASGWEIGRKRKVTINNFRGKFLIDIREYYEKDGEELPGRKGISLSLDQWKKLKEIIPKVDRALGD